jgi:hypothetical protein
MHVSSSSVIESVFSILYSHDLVQLLLGPAAWASYTHTHTCRESVREKESCIYIDTCVCVCVCVCVYEHMNI